MLGLVVPDKKEELQRQVDALKHLIKTDQNDKDRMIHKSALSMLEKVVRNNWDKDRISYEMLREAKMLEVLMVFGNQVENKVKKLKLNELENIIKYGLMGFGIDEALEYKNVNPYLVK